MASNFPADQNDRRAAFLRSILRTEGYHILILTIITLKLINLILELEI